MSDRELLGIMAAIIHTCTTQSGSIPVQTAVELLTEVDDVLAYAAAHSITTCDPCKAGSVSEKGEENL